MRSLKVKFFSTLLFICLFTSIVWAENFNQLVIFGDSLSDSGNIYQATLQSFPPSPPYGGIPEVHPEQAPGRFTDGKVWIEYLAAKLTLAPISARGVLFQPNGTNYSYGGAATGETPISYTSTLGPSSTGGTPILKQIDLYLSDINSGYINSPGQNSLIVLWAGSNDILLLKKPSPSKSVKNMETGLRKLLSAGAKKILLLNLPLLASTPAVTQQLPSIFVTSNTAKDVAKQVIKFNHLLDELIQELKQEYPEVTFYQFDVSSLMGDILSRPSLYGINNLTRPVINEPKLYLQGQLVIQSNPFTSFFFDGVHPTTRLHEILADGVFKILQ